MKNVDMETMFTVLNEDTLSGILLEVDWSYLMTKHNHCHYFTPPSYRVGCCSGRMLYLRYSIRRRSEREMYTSYAGMNICAKHAVNALQLSDEERLIVLSFLVSGVPWKRG